MVVRETLAALALGAALALSACGGDDKNGAAGEGPVPAAPGETMDFLTASPTRMTSDGCSADLSFTWEAIDSTSVPPGAEAVIKVKGPGIAGTYTRNFDDSGKVTLKLSTRVDRSNAEWDATLVSVDGQAPSSAPPITHPFLNTECGNGQPTPASSLPPGTPVPGAPCTPGQPLPPGFVCK